MAGVLEVLDVQGWQREYSLEKSIIYIGSAPDSDIVLESTYAVTIALRHLQLVAGAGASQGYRLVNLSDGEIVIEGANGSEDKTIASFSSSYVVTGDRVRLGDFTLVFHSIDSAVGENMGSVKNISISISLPQKQVLPKRTLEGMITMRNLGEQSGVQFDLELEGLDAECYEIGPRPILFSGDEKSVFFSIYHLGEKPMAGHYRVTIRATTEAYPLETAVAVQNIEFLPYYHHKLNFSPADEQTETAPAASEKETQAAESAASAPPEKVAPPAAVVSPQPPAKEGWGKRLARWLPFGRSEMVPRATSAETPAVPPAEQRAAGAKEEAEGQSDVAMEFEDAHVAAVPQAAREAEAEVVTPMLPEEIGAEEIPVAEERAAYPAPRTVEAEDVAALRDAIVEEFKNVQPPAAKQEAQILTPPAPEETAPRGGEKAWWLEEAETAAPAEKPRAASMPPTPPTDVAPREEEKAWWLEEAETAASAEKPRAAAAPPAPLPTDAAPAGRTEPPPRESEKAWWLEEAETAAPAEKPRAAAPPIADAAPAERAETASREVAPAPATKIASSPPKTARSAQREVMPPRVSPQQKTPSVALPEGEGVLPSGRMRRRGDAWWLDDAQDAKEVEKSLVPDVKLPEVKGQNPAAWWEEEAETPPELEEDVV